MKQNSPQYLIILLIVAMNSIGLSIILPLLPFIVETYLQSDYVVWAISGLFSIYALCSFITAPILGSLSDVYGRKKILLLSLFGSALGYLLFGIGGSLFILFLGRIIDGITAGNTSVLFAYISDNTQQKDRIKWFGYISAAMGIGKIGGPVLGGILGGISIALPFYITAFLMLISGLIVYFFLPESKQKKQSMKEVNHINFNVFKLLSAMFQLKPIRFYLLIGILFYLILTVFQFNYTLVLKDTFQLTPTSIGVLFTLIGVFEILSRAVFLPYLLHRYSSKLIQIFGLSLITMGLLSIVGSLYFPMVLFVPIALSLIIIGEGLFEPTYINLLSTAVSEDEQGKIQGANQSLQALNTIVVPLFAGAVYYHNPTLHYVLLSVLAMGSIFYVKKMIR
ncbi:MFS transporter [Myroides sp. TSA_177.3]|uniref:MFS transporter n=1 Tax=Myroides sp. TSA_177.3 TaxID=3415650 RepID=UPI0040452ECD